MYKLLSLLLLHILTVSSTGNPAECSCQWHSRYYYCYNQLPLNIGGSMICYNNEWTFLDYLSYDGFNMQTSLPKYSMSSLSLTNPHTSTDSSFEPNICKFNDIDYNNGTHISIKVLESDINWVNGVLICVNSKWILQEMYKYYGYSPEYDDFYYNFL